MMKTTSLENLISSLNPQQREAAVHKDGPLLILAGAGSGKTKVLTHRIAYLIGHYGVRPEEILAVTFTNKAAQEMKERIEKLLGPQAVKNLWVGTFHAICSRILRTEIEKLPYGYKQNYVILDSSEQQSVIKEAIITLGLDTKNFSPGQVLSIISQAKNNMMMAEEFMQEADTLRYKTVANIYAYYQNQLRRTSSLDFDDLLLLVAKLFQTDPATLEFWQRRFRYFLIDEYQDTNFTQYQLVNLLSKKSRNLCVVGDVDQSIYSWRGADYKNILIFNEDYADAKVITLEQNYRSTQNILAVANQIITNNTARQPKNLWSDKGEGEKVTCYEAADELDESDYVIRNLVKLKKKGDYRYRDCAVLYRTNAQSRAIEEACVRTGIPYRLIGGVRFYERKEVKDILAYLRLLYNPLDEISLRRIINVPKRNIGPATLAKLELLVGPKGSLYDAVMMAKEKDIKGASDKVKEFGELILELKELSLKTPVAELIEATIEKSGYRLELEAEGTEEAQERIANIEELVSVAKEFELHSEDVTLGAFLNQMSLLTDLDTADNTQDAVTLITLHGAKGLEFPVVFMVGLEEGIFPHRMAYDAEKNLEEERRLCYVGVTRAQEKLYFTYARRRMVYGETQYNQRSRFIEEAPAHLIEHEGSELTQPREGLSFRENYNLNPPSRPAPVFASKGAAGARTLPEPSDNAIQWKAGDEVVHPTFGNGKVQEVLGEGSKAILNVTFQGVGKRLLDPRYAPLKKKE